MGLIEHLHPPAFLPDFDRVPGLRAQWSQAVSDWLEFARYVQSEAFRKQGVCDAEVQFFNPLKQSVRGRILEQPVVWNAFPKQLARKYGLEHALELADNTPPFQESSGATRHLDVPYRLGNEYCEWRVIPDDASKRIRKIIFTSEPPEYWAAMFGGRVEYCPHTGQASIFTGDRSVVLQLYKKLVGDEVQPDDLIVNGKYNHLNKWNTTHGIVHLTHPANSILAEINLAAAATIVRKDSRNRILSEPEELICGGYFGNPNRNSDPTIGATVNALARQGANISLQDPVGVYMDHIDLAGWTAPNDEDASHFVRITRGRPGMITRLEIEVPPDRDFLLGDVKIGGVPISYGGQIAECVTVKLVAIAADLGSVRNPALDCASRCYIIDEAPLELHLGTKVPADGHVVFLHKGEAERLTKAGLLEARFRDQLGEPARSHQKQAAHVQH